MCKYALLIILLHRDFDVGPLQSAMDESLVVDTEIFQ